MKFRKDILRALAYGEDEENILVIKDEVTGTTRWSTQREMIFKVWDGPDSFKFYRVTYSVGSTEMQDERPFEYEPTEIECPEVRPVERTVTVYEDV